MLRYQRLLRVLPLAAGGMGIAAVLVNRLVSGVRAAAPNVHVCFQAVQHVTLSPACSHAHACLLQAARALQRVACEAACVTCMQIAPVVDASSAQSRADVLAIGLSAVLLLQGLQWLSLAPKPVTAVPPDADFVEWLDPALPAAARLELEWCATAFRSLLTNWRSSDDVHSHAADCVHM